MKALRARGGGGRLLILSPFPTLHCPCMWHVPCMDDIQGGSASVYAAVYAWATR
jgi:hypothetical protein